ncbi:putative serine/threonine-protein kinase pbl19 [Asimina triloba]
MKCLFYFKDKSSSRKTKSAPAANEGRKSSQAASGGGGVRKAKSLDCRAASSSRGIPELFAEKAHNLRAFSLAELEQATNNFNRLLKLGEGGFGSVYKGFVDPPGGNGDRIPVAIKMLSKGSLQGHKQWFAEIQFLAIVEHPNLVKLIGYCAEDGARGPQRLLVYEYIPNKTLEDHLFSPSLPLLPWKRRLEIILGAAQGLQYLHEGLEVQVIYRDFKASNVLLDVDFNTKLSDFGLAREGPTGSNTHVSTAVVGTYGYAAPDYVETGHLTIKSDVWSFGVVLYEILTGRRSFERFRPRSEQKLLDWVKEFPVDSNKFSMIMDQRLRGQYSLSAARMVAKLANRCLSKQKNDRPMMSEVVEVLKQAIQDSETLVPPVLKAASSSETSLDADKKPAHVRGSEYSRRRMAHVAQLRENADAVGGRPT